MKKLLFLFAAFMVVMLFSASAAVSADWRRYTPTPRHIHATYTPTATRTPLPTATNTRVVKPTATGTPLPSCWAVRTYIQNGVSLTQWQFTDWAGRVYNGIFPSNVKPNCQ